MYGRNTCGFKEIPHHIFTMFNDHIMYIHVPYMEVKDLWARSFGEPGIQVTQRKVADPM